MSITEIKDLTKFLSEEEVEEIKKEIKSKEDILKNGNLDEEEMIQVLNTLFAILVIEKALESEIEGVEEIRDELEEELIDAYNVYDSYMEKYKKEDKKNKKKWWFLDFLGLSENIRNKKQNIANSNKTIDNLNKELNNLKKQRSNENLSKVANKNDLNLFNDFFDCPHECKNPRHDHNHEIGGRRDEKRKIKGDSPRKRKFVDHIAVTTVPSNPTNTDNKYNNQASDMKKIPEESNLSKLNSATRRR